MLYYTGHGALGSGNWIFDGNRKQVEVSIEEIIEIIPKSVEKVFISSDACSSGHWADYCVRKRNCKLEIFASSPYFQSSYDGKFAGWLFNNNKPIPVFGLYDYSDGENPKKKNCQSKILWKVINFEKA